MSTQAVNSLLSDMVLEAAKDKCHHGHSGRHQPFFRIALRLHLDPRLRHRPWASRQSQMVTDMMDINRDPGCDRDMGPYMTPGFSSNTNYFIVWLTAQTIQIRTVPAGVWPRRNLHDHTWKP